MAFSKCLIAAHGSDCPYCGDTMAIPARKRGRPRVSHPRFPTRDHINPKHAGGGDTVIVCRQCNSDKGGLTLNEWLKRLSASGDPRASFVSAFANAASATLDKGAA